MSIDELEGPDRYDEWEKVDRMIERIHERERRQRRLKKSRSKLLEQHKEIDRLLTKTRKMRGA